MHVRLDDTYDLDLGLRQRLVNDMSLLHLDWRTLGGTEDRYLATACRPQKVAHYYAFVLAHLVGGGTQVAASARPYLPPWFFTESQYFNDLPSPLPVYDAINDEAMYWTTDDENLCLKELATAFQVGRRMISMF